MVESLEYPVQSSLMAQHTVGQFIQQGFVLITQVAGTEFDIEQFIEIGISLINAREDFCRNTARIVTQVLVRTAMIICLLIIVGHRMPKKKSRQSLCLLLGSKLTIR